MANIKFTQLPDQGLPTDSTIIPTVASGINYTVSAANLRTYVNSTTGNVTAGNLNITGNITDTAGNLQINSVGLINLAPATGVAITGFASVTGNITGNYILGNGSQLTGLPATYGNANVATFLGAFGSNAISTTGNVTAGYVVGNGSLLTNLNIANATVANATYANTAGIATTSNYATNAGAATVATTAGTVTTAAQPAITSVGTLNSLSVAGNITAGGNISGAYLFGNGSGITGIVATSTYGNANVAAYLPTYTGALSALTGAVTTTANITGGNLSTAGNVTGSYIKGNGSQLSGLVTSIVAGTGISVNVSTGAVTVTATGGGSGGSSISNGFAFANTAATTAGGGNIVWIYNGSVAANANWAGNTIVIQNQQGSNSAGMVFAPDGNINASANNSTGFINLAPLVNVNGTLYVGLGGSTQTTINYSGITATNIDISAGAGTGLIIPRATAAVTRTYTGSAGSIRAVTDSPTYAGQLAYWCTTATAQWRYVATNTAV
jgi:hypothetical protein